MKRALQITSWFQIVLGGLAIADGVGNEDFYAFLGGFLFAGAGAIALAYISEVSKK